MLETTVRGINQIKKDVQAEKKQSEKALQTAVKVEAFGLRSTLKKEIRAGAPGGQKFEPLSFLARRKRGSQRFGPNKPLSKLATPIMYHVQSTNPYTVAVGWTGPKVSQSWKKIARRQQEGFTSDITNPRKHFFRHRGEELSERSTNRKYFFLRKTTAQLKTPAREIADPFYKAHNTQAWKNIQNNFRRKMKGERI